LETLGFIITWVEVLTYLVVIVTWFHYYLGRGADVVLTYPVVLVTWVHYYLGGVADVPSGHYYLGSLLLGWRC
jgi:hypothetical protein